ncbi:alpha/beta hydrolase [Mesorhizobium sp. ASY16-5R]|uniref:alpha/beta hydrolase n=1 Tax=Mesorhizobium sp. ASY16-5R TaxID=3445772 RepID=UPI003FA12EEE
MALAHGGWMVRGVRFDMARLAGKLAACIALLSVALATAAYFVTPWPSVLVIRAIFDRGAAEASAKLEKHLPSGISVDGEIHYNPSDPDAVLDIVRPPAGTATGTTIVWVHGGGFISGRRADVENYARVLAGEGFTLVNVDYTIAPEATYPTPVQQVNEALGFLSREADRLGIDPDRLIIAGDSAGAQIAAQVANLVTAPGYARQVGFAAKIKPEQLCGTILFCGPYDLDLMGQSWFMRTTTWAYSGRRNHREDPSFQLMSVAKYVTSAFPPSFISAGNGDPLLPHSAALEDALRSRGVTVDTLYFPMHEPPLGHEYQFDLDAEPGRDALRQMVAFARRVG